jgi:hypothetical protein
MLQNPLLFIVLFWHKAVVAEMQMIHKPIGARSRPITGGRRQLQCTDIR